MKIRFYDLETFELIQTLEVRKIDPIQLNRIAIGIERETDRRVTYREPGEPAPANKQQEIKFI